MSDGPVTWQDPIFANPDSPSFDPNVPDNFINRDAGYTGNSFSDFWTRITQGVPGPDETAAASAQVKQNILKAGGSQADADAATKAMADELAQSAKNNPTNVDNLNPLNPDNLVKIFVGGGDGSTSNSGGASLIQVAAVFVVLAGVGLVLSFFKH